MKVLLPFCVEETVKAYQYHSYIHGMIMGQGNDLAKKYLCYLGMHVKCDDRGGSFRVNFPGDCPVLLHNIRYTPTDLFMRGSIDLPLDYVRSHQKEIMTEIFDMIKAEFYVHGYLNVESVEGKRWVAENSKTHDFLLTGCDMEREVVYMAGYFDEWLYEIREIDFDTFLKSVYSRTDHYSSMIQLYKVKPDFDMEINTEMLCSALRQIADSSPVMLHDNLTLETNMAYGREALECLVGRIAAYAGERENIQSIRAYLEHLRYFCAVIQDFSELIKEDDVYQELLECEKTAESIVILIVKYMLSKNKADLLRVKQFMSHTVALELRVIEDILKLLQRDSGAETRTGKEITVP